MTQPSYLLILTACAVLLLGGSMAGSVQGLAQLRLGLEPAMSAEELEEQALSAQMSLTAVPARLGDDLSLALDPGASQEVTLQVINTGDEAVTVRSHAQDFLVFDDGQQPIPVDRAATDNRWSLASWLTLAPGVQTIQPGELASLRVVIQVPDDALPGGRYAMVLHQPDVADPTGVTEVAQSGIEPRVGTLLYVRVNGFVQEDALIRDFSLPRFTEFGPVPFGFTVENLSDIHIRPRVTVEIENLFGRRVETIPLDEHNIFPYTARAYEGKWARVWGIGPYTARIVMSYGTQGNVMMASERFWLLPVSLLLAVAAVLLALLAGGIAVRRHLLHRQQDQRQRIRELEAKLERLQSSKAEQPDKS